ncbi:hypothetical protein GCM10007913_30490 [Devosia yakushimensis]|uniref:Uncharacterized protein n=1 Tax=Devosia yakushimensis TaxID=470028 RepID=A0ABQ5UG97_9HYPH|nr:hypothetical protein [Devosia yakushimensis]GLQ11117.1 hypothetical protein GCM10007913_30490 [Devosia yakushimensis]
MRLAILATILLTTTPAFAVDAITYKGTLGDHEIIVELAAPGPNQLIGRYSYMAKGGDIPLDVNGSVGTAAITMFEEAPCTEATCTQDDDGNVANPPVSAIWTLTASADGASYAGEWVPMNKSKSLPIALTEIARRTLPDDAEITPYGLRDSTFELFYGGEAIFAPHTAPYDFAKMEVVMDAGETETLEGSTFRYVTDPRTKFPFPRILSLSDGSLVQQANEALERRHTVLNFFAFDCMAQVYAGFGANEYSLGMGAGTLGDYDSENIVLTYLSPTVMNWVESGSTYCTGAHPNNHSDTYIADTKTGEPFPLGKVFKDWVASYKMDSYGEPVDQAAALEAPGNYIWTAGQPLIDYAIANRTPNDESDLDDQCGLDDLIASNLALRFVPGDQVLFTIEGLPHVNFACSQDLLTVKLSDVPELLAPTAKDYFPALQ